MTADSNAVMYIAEQQTMVRLAIAEAHGDEQLVTMPLINKKTPIATMVSASIPHATKVACGKPKG